MYVNNGSGQDGILFWGLTPYDNNAQINTFKANFGITNPCAGYQGGSVAAIDVVIEGQNFFGYPTYCVICPDRTLHFNVCYPPTEACFEQYFEGCVPQLSVLPAHRNVTAPKGVTTFDITSNTDWTVIENVSWLNTSVAGGSGNKTLKVNYEANATGQTRSGSILISSSHGSQSVIVTQASYAIHNISLRQGWNGLSSYIMPADNNIEQIFNPVAGSFVIANTMTGIYYPTESLNTIIVWESQSAYLVKMSAPATIQIIGNPEENKTLLLSAGWNLLPVICDSPVDAASLLSPLDLKLVKEVVGSGVLWPDLDINTIGDLQPGAAYYVLLNANGVITFPRNSD
jgi:hypothetical protein